MTRFSKKLQNWFGSSRTSKPRRTTRLGLERLDDRLLPSNTGAISSVYAGGNTVTFEVRRDENFYCSINGGYQHQLSFWNQDYEVSAGTDQFGHPVAYILNNKQELWALTINWTNEWDPNDTAYISNFTKVADHVVYDTYNHVCAFSAAMGRDYATGIQGGVFYISNGYDRYFNFVQDYQISNVPADYEISAGTDKNGYNVAYVLNVGDHNVYKRHADGLWYKIDCQGGCMEIAGSVNNILYTLQDPYAPEDGAPYYHSFGWWLGGQNVTGGIPFEWNGVTWTGANFGGFYATHISAGTDIWGNSTLDYLATPFDLGGPQTGQPYLAYQFNAATNGTTFLAANVSDVCAAYGTDYFVGTAGNSPVYERNGWNGLTFQIGDAVRHDAYWW